MEFDTCEPFIVKEITVNGKTFDVMIRGKDEQEFDMAAQRAANPTPRRTGFERQKGYRYYILNDDYAYLDEADEVFDDVNYQNANYFCTEALAKNMSRVINLFNRMVRFAAEFGSYAHIGLDENGSRVYEIDYSAGDNDLQVNSAFGVTAFTPLFGDEHTARMAAEEFREDLLWYFKEFLPSMKEGKYV